MTVAGKEVENKAESEDCDQSQNTQINPKAQGPALGFSHARLCTLVISKYGVKGHSLQVRKEVRGINKALQNWFYFHMHRRPFKEQGTTHHLLFLPRFQHILGQQCPNSGEVLSSAAETLQTFLWASWAMNVPGRLTPTCWDPPHLFLAFPGELGNRAAVPGRAPRQRLCLNFCPTAPEKSRSSSKEHMMLRQAAP